MATPCSFSKKNDSIMPLDKIRTKRRLFNVCVRVFIPYWNVAAKYLNKNISVPQMHHFFCLHTCQDQNGTHLIRWLFSIICKSITGPLSEAKTLWMINWLQLLNQLDFVWRHIIILMMSPICATVENHGEFMLMLRAQCTLSATASLFTGVRTIYLLSRFGLSVRMPVSFTFFTR